MDPDLITRIESGEVSRQDAVLTTVELYREAWTRIAYVREIMEALVEVATAAELNEVLDRMQNAMDEHFEIDMDGNMTVRA